MNMCGNIFREGRHDSYSRCGGGKGSELRGWPPEERCTKTPDFGSGHTPPRGKAKGARGLDSKSMEAFIKICKLLSVSMVPVEENKKLARSLTHYLCWECAR
jgi:hypothetical protein